MISVNNRLATKLMAVKVSLCLMFCSMTIQAQTVVRVVIDQPEKLEIIVTDDLFTEMDNSIVFGETISVNGCTGYQ